MDETIFAPVTAMELQLFQFLDFLGEQAEEF